MGVFTLLVLGVIMKIVFLLCSCIILVNACGRSNRSPHSFELRRNRGTYGVTYKYSSDNWDAHIGGGVGPGRNWEVGVGVEVPFRKKRAESHEDKFNVTLHVDPCFFLIYDLDRDGEFTEDELQTIFGNDLKAKALFADLDADPSDGVIKEEEFVKNAPQIITNCFQQEKLLSQ